MLRTKEAFKLFQHRRGDINTPNVPIYTLHRVGFTEPTLDQVPREPLLYFFLL